MTNRWRVLLALLGLALVLASLAMLAYMAWPTPPAREQHQPAPTLFAPPGASLDLPGSWAPAAALLGGPNGRGEP
jgi:hypothetical protein